MRQKFVTKLAFTLILSLIKKMKKWVEQSVYNFLTANIIFKKKEHHLNFVLIDEKAVFKLLSVPVYHIKHAAIQNMDWTRVCKYLK